MTFSEICSLFGGPSAVNRILGNAEKSVSNVSKACSNNTPTKKWLPILQKEALKKAEELNNFAKQKTPHK